MTALNTKAINRARALVDNAKHDLLVLISLHRAENGRNGRFSFRASGREEWYTARIDEVVGIGQVLTIDIDNSGLHFSQSLTAARDLRDRMVEV